jgi:hypothetical protein
VEKSAELKQHDFPEDKTREVEKTPETLSKDAIFPNTETLVKDTTNQGGSIALISPIPSLTPLATSFDLPCSEVINIDELTPIESKDIPFIRFIFQQEKENYHTKGISTKGGRNYQKKTKNDI